MSFITVFSFLTRSTICYRIKKDILISEAYKPDRRRSAENGEDMSKTHILAFFCAILIVSPDLGFAASTVITGSVTSVAAYADLRASIRSKVKAGKQAVFASCVCAKDRGKIVYAYSLNSSDGTSLPNDCKKAAADCGGCFKPPALAQLSSQAAVNQARETRSNQRKYQAVFGDGEAFPTQPRSPVGETPRFPRN